MPEVKAAIIIGANRRRLPLAALLLALACTAVCLPVFADEDWEVDTSGIGRQNNGVVYSGQILELGVPMASGLRVEGETYLRQGKLDQAIVVLQRAVEMAPGDVENRIQYATALERKLFRQPRDSRDPKLFNFIVKNWLCVAESAEFADEIMEGYNHLTKLTGSAPKKREKEKKFLQRVLFPEDGSVPVVIGPRTEAKVVAKVRTASKSDNQE